MRLLRASDVPMTDRDRVFRASPVGATITTALVLAGSGALIGFGWREQAWIFHWIAGVSLSILLLLQRFVLARFRSSNWLVRVGDSGVFIQLRSYLNHHLPADDLTVLQLAPGEIRSVGKVHEKRAIPYREAGERAGRVTEERRTLVEIETGSDTAGLRDALQAERARRGPREKRWYGSTSVVYRHYPVRVAAPDRIEIEWRVSPSPDAFFALLQPHVPIAGPRKVVTDFTGLAAADREQQESKLLELAESGQTMAAIALARRIYGYDLTQAKAFVDGLLGVHDEPRTGTDGRGAPSRG